MKRQKHLIVMLCTLALLLVGCPPAGSTRASAAGASAALYTWGLDRHGQLGDGNNGYGVFSSTPGAITFSSGVTATTIAGGYQHSLAVGSDGQVYTWGFNYTGQLGNGQSGLSAPDTLFPQATTLGSGVTATAVSGGYDHSLAIGSDGKIYGWGDNLSGELGTGAITNTGCACIPTPQAISLATGVTATAIDASNEFSLAIGSDGKLYSWGDNGTGELGTGGAVNAGCDCVPSPGAVSLAPGVSTTAIAGGWNHGLAIGSDGKLYSWGNNSTGQLGNGTTSVMNSVTPAAITLASGVTATAIAAGEGHSLALGSDGKLYSWGRNDLGQVGNGTTTTTGCSCIPTPQAITLPGGVTATAIAAGINDSLALGSDGKVYSWGYNGDGELGDGTTTNSSVPVQVTKLSGVSAIASGGFHTLVLARPPAATTHFRMDAPATATTGQSLYVTVTALKADGTTDPNYQGTVNFSSTDPGVTLPPYTFSSTDAGVHTFTVTLSHPGWQTIGATDSATSAISGTSPAVAVTQMTSTGSSTITIQAGAGWNLVGGSPLTLWSGSSNAWSFNALTQSWYHPTGSEAPGTAVWQDVSVAGSQSSTAQGCSGSVTVPTIAYRWNMVGNPCSQTVTLPSTAHAYLWDTSSSRYVLIKSIGPGSAAWVKPASSLLSLTPVTGAASPRSAASRHAALERAWHHSTDLPPRPPLWAGHTPLGLTPQHHPPAHTGSRSGLSGAGEPGGNNSGIPAR